MESFLIIRFYNQSSKKNSFHFHDNKESLYNFNSIDVNKGFDFNILPIMVINKVGMYIIIFKYKIHSHGKVLDFKIIQILYLLQFPCHFRYCSHDVNMNLRLNVSVKVRLPLPLPSSYNFWLALPIV